MSQKGLRQTLVFGTIIFVLALIGGSVVSLSQVTSVRTAPVSQSVIAGIVQVYLWRIVGLDFMTVRTQYLTFWLLLVFIFGLVIFLPGSIVFLWDFFGLRKANEEGQRQNY